MEQMNTSKYSTETGDAIASQPFESSLRREEPGLPRGVNPHQVAARGFAQAFGLHPAIAFVTVTVDLMAHASFIVSGGLLWPVEVGAALVLGYVTFKGQMLWFGDDRESAKVKAVVVALVTAIPSPLPYFLFIPSGLLGLLRKRG